MRARILTLAVAILASTALIAQPPDCTGISPVLSGDPDLLGQLDSVRVASGLAFPVFVTGVPGDDSRLLVLEKAGRIRVINDGVLNATPYLDIDAIVTGGSSTNDERGLLGMALHPNYANNGFVYVFYTAQSPTGSLTIARYTRMTDDLANPASGTILLQIPHSISNHNGGMIEFGPDGALYAGTGDGGSGCDPGAFPGNAQNTSSLLGKLLRLDVDGGTPYSTAGNPFDGPTVGADEVWHYGLRNPWRWSFDLQSGALLIGDVGQNTREELNCVANGVNERNFGWNAYEGFSCDTCNEWAPACPIALTNYTPPYADFSLSGTPCAVVGGYSYRGCRMPVLHGTYFYSDFCDDFVNTRRTDGACTIGGATNREDDIEPGGAISIGSIASYGQDNQGEMYIVDQNGGEIFKIIPDMSIMEVSGPGATPLTINGAGDFMWEDLEASSDIPTRFYKVYRADSFDPQGGFGTFDCIRQQSATSVAWPGGDAAVPAVGEAFYYLVTAERFTTLVESTAGADSSGNLRVVDTASACN